MGKSSFFLTKLVLDRKFNYRGFRKFAAIFANVFYLETSHHPTMIITTTITSEVMTITMTFTMMTSVTRRRKRTRTTIITSQNHQVLLSQSQTQYHQVIMVTQPNQAMDHITVEFTPEVVSTLLLVTHNLMHQHQACQITGSDLLTLLIHGRHFHGKLEKVKLQHGQPI